MYHKQYDKNETTEKIKQMSSSTKPDPGNLQELLYYKSQRI